ncbi:1-propanol dehydrogenase PduQ [Fusibacter sp. 3D3]|uniref:1-propanol dehydrogenase PduQ n=1 Tax=Fusibacter sp. 3D3 TaxID=1048380 RepID=UPI0008532F8C|nr:1-propanol dehydrogenase PduQ [Fusibacter sp. 3D3]
MNKFVLDTDLISGEGTIEYIRTLPLKKVCIVTDTMMVKLGIVDRVTGHLNASRIEYKIFDRVEANPSLETVNLGLHHIIDYKPEALIAIGGGSVIDAAKAIIYFCIKTKESLLDKTHITKPIFIAIPTTSGTGSEVTAISVITDSKTHTKIPLKDALMLPDVAILDSSLTLSVPKPITADTGMDVITHAIEAYVATGANRFTNLFVEEAIKLAFNNLLKAYYNGNNKIARQHMHDASCMAGIGFNNAGLGINHSLAHAIGGHFGVSHGRANAILLPYIIAFNSGLEDGLVHEFGKPYAQLANLIRVESEEMTVKIKSLIEVIKQFNKKMEIPETFEAYGIDPEAYYKAIPEMAQSAFDDICTTTNPRIVTLKVLEKRLEQAFRGR